MGRKPTETPQDQTREVDLDQILKNQIRTGSVRGRLALRWWADDDGGHVSVADTGIGIAAEHLPRLTERFYRVDRSRSRETGGTGLGLAIVKHVAQRHGGQVEVQSTPGQGSIFMIHLPASRIRQRSIA